MKDEIGGFRESAGPVIVHHGCGVFLDFFQAETMNPVVGGLAESRHGEHCFGHIGNGTGLVEQNGYGSVGAQAEPKVFPVQKIYDLFELGM